MANWIKGAIKHPGSLRVSLGIKSGKNIPKSKLSVKPGDSGVTKKRKILAKTLASFRRK